MGERRFERDYVSEKIETKTSNSIAFDSLFRSDSFSRKFFDYNPDKI